MIPDDYVPKNYTSELLRYLLPDENFFSYMISEGVDEYAEQKHIKRLRESVTSISPMRIIQDDN